MGQRKKELTDRTMDAVTASFDFSNRLLSTEEVARILVVPVTTLYSWRYKNTGPKAFRVGKHLRYRLSDVVAWLENQAGE